MLLLSFFKISPFKINILHTGKAKLRGRLTVNSSSPMCLPKILTCCRLLYRPMAFLISVLSLTDMIVENKLKTKIHVTLMLTMYVL